MTNENQPGNNLMLVEQISPSNSHADSYEQAATNIEHIPIGLCDRPAFHFLSYEERKHIEPRANDINPLSPPILIVAKVNGRYVIIDGVLNWLAMRLRGMHMVSVQVIDCDPADFAYESIKRNKRKKITHRMIAMMIPVITEWWTRHNTGDDKDRKRKFIADTLEDLGTNYGERNIQKLLDIIRKAPTLIDKMDNTDRIIDKFHKKAKIHAGEIPAEGTGEPSAPLHSAKEDDEENSDANCSGCDPGNRKPTGTIVKLSIVTNTGDEISREIDSSQFCRKCIVNRIIFEAVNPVLSPEEGTDPEEAIVVEELLSFSKGNAKIDEDVYIFDLPAGHACPSAFTCQAKADRDTGEITDGANQIFRCYAATDERWPNLRDKRWKNFDMLRNMNEQEMVVLITNSLPPDATKVRLHSSGDLFNIEYTNAWVEVARKNSNILFYGYTKSVEFIKHINLPDNLVLTVSLGGRQDHLIDETMQTVKVVFSPAEAESLNLEIDHDDSHAMVRGGNFAILLHGTQPPGTQAAEALKQMRQNNIDFSYSRNGGDI